MVMVEDILNYEELEKCMNELENKYVDYIPLRIQTELHNPVKYYDRMTLEAIEKTQEVRNGLGKNNQSIEEYFIQDIIDWVNENPEFKSIIKWELIQ